MSYYSIKAKRVTRVSCFGLFVTFRMIAQKLENSERDSMRSLYVLNAWQKRFESIKLEFGVPVSHTLLVYSNHSSHWFFPFFPLCVCDLKASQFVVYLSALSPLSRSIYSTHVKISQNMWQTRAPCYQRCKTSARDESRRNGFSMIEYSLSTFYSFFIATNIVFSDVCAICVTCVSKMKR